MNNDARKIILIKIQMYHNFIYIAVFVNLNKQTINTGDLSCVSGPFE